MWEETLKGGFNMKWKYVSMVLIAIMLAGAGFAYRYEMDNQERIDRERMVQGAKLEAKLSKWIYEHSTRISTKTCTEIACEVAKTNKPNLILAIITVESENVPSAVSNKGAKGLGQIMFKSHGDTLIKNGIIKEERDLFDIVPNVRATDYVISACLKQSQNDVTKALTGYLGGQDGWYVKRILEHNANLDVIMAQR
jgi:soluble lytic murein transglycosylase-like protein